MNTDRLRYRVTIRAILAIIDVPLLWFDPLVIREIIKKACEEYLAEPQKGKL